MRKALPKSCLFVMVFLLFSSPINATQLEPAYWWSLQTVDFDHNYVTVSKEGLYVKFEGRIVVDKSIHNLSDYVSFNFRPLFDSRFEAFDNYSSYVGLQTDMWDGVGIVNALEANMEANYSGALLNGVVYQYNVSLVNLSGENSIIFKASYRLKNKINRVQEAQYMFYYIDNTVTSNRYVAIYFPYKYTILKRPEFGEWEFGTIYQTYLPEMNSLEI